MHTRRGMNEISVDKREERPNSAGRGRVFGMQESGWRTQCYLMIGKVLVTPASIKLYITVQYTSC